MRIVFMGTPPFAATILNFLIPQHEVVGVFTRPDAIRGRGKKLVPSAVKEVALASDIPVFEYSSFREESAFESLLQLNPDVICVAAYGALLPKKVLELPRYGCLNVHASLLPRWRGAAPIERAILAGEYEAGVCVMKMEEGLDEGDYCVSRAIEIADMTASQLTSELADLGADSLLAALSQLEQGQAFWIKQDNTLVTYAKKIEKNELNISPSMTADEAYCHVKASGESHSSRCVIADKTVTMLDVVKPDSKNEQIPSVEQGKVAFVAKRLFLGFKAGVLEVLQLKPEGKKQMDALSFAAGIQGIKKTGADWQELYVE